MLHQAMNVKWETVAPCMTCRLCHKLFRDATTIIECLHTFCRKCIHKKLSEEEMKGCPICSTDLGCIPMEKLRSDHKLQGVRTKTFPYKRIMANSHEVGTPVVLPAKRKERSLSSLEVSTPRVSAQTGMTGRRSQSVARKKSNGSNFTVEKPVKNTNDDPPESSGSPEMMNKSTQCSGKSSASDWPSNDPSCNKGKENHSELGDDKIDLWKPPTCLVEAENGSRSSKSSTQGSLVISENQHSYDIEAPLGTNKSKEQRRKLKVMDDKDEKVNNDNTPMESERPKMLRKIRQKAREFGEFRVPPQVALDAARDKPERKGYPVWFCLVASDEMEGDAPPLPQIPASYLRIIDGNIPVSFIQKYLQRKLDLNTEVEVDIKFMGQTVIPTLTLNNLVGRESQSQLVRRAFCSVSIIHYLLLAL